MLPRAACVLSALVAAACGAPPLEPRDPTPGVPHFTVQTYNVEFRSSSDSSTVSAVGRGGADVVCLQEVTDDWARVLSNHYAEQYPHMIFHTAGGTGGLGVLSKYELEDLGVHPGPRGWHPAWHVLANTPMGPVQVLNVHLRSMLSGRDSDVEAYLELDTDHAYEIQLFSEACDGEIPTLVVGDFNEEPDGAAVRFLEKNGFENALALYHPGQGTWRYDSVAGQFDMALDHILFDGSFEPLNSWVVRKGNSDHLPVLAHLEDSGR